MKKLEIVTGLYNDKHKLDMWINNPILQNNSIIIYEKDDTLPKDYLYKANSKTKENNKTYIKLPNIGSCDFSFLYHIVHNYDSLADTTIFTKGNWMDHTIDFLNIYSKCLQYDFMYQGTMRKLQIWKPTDLQPYFNAGLPWYDIENCYQDEVRYKLYTIVFGDLDEPEPFIGWGQGPCFSVSKELIQRHPKQVYENLLNLFNYKNYEFNSLKYPSFENQMWHVGRSLHDNFSRFYIPLFTHGLPKEHSFNIQNATFKCV